MIRSDIVLKRRALGDSEDRIRMLGGCGMGFQAGDGDGSKAQDDDGYIPCTKSREDVYIAESDRHGYGLPGRGI